MLELKQDAEVGARVLANFSERVRQNFLRHRRRLEQLKEQQAAQ